MCLGFFAAFAQKEKKFNDTAYLQPVEVLAIRAGEKAPFAKTDITKKEIAKNNLGQDLPFLLNQTPSVVINSDAGNGVGYTGIRIRGTDAARINVTLNGIPYNDAESQGTFFVDLPDFASSANSIQVQRGVGTSTNGAGSFGGTINITTNELNKDFYASTNNRQIPGLADSLTLENAHHLGETLFADSKHSVFIQLVDLVSYLLLQLDREELDPDKPNSSYRLETIACAKQIRGDLLGRWRGKLQFG